MTAPSPSSAAVRQSCERPTVWAGSPPAAVHGDPERLSLSAWLLAKLREGRAA